MSCLDEVRAEEDRHTQHHEEAERSVTELLFTGTCGNREARTMSMRSSLKFFTFPCTNSFRRQDTWTIQCWTCIRRVPPTRLVRRVIYGVSIPYKCRTFTELRRFWLMCSSVVLLLTLYIRMSHSLYDSLIEKASNSIWNHLQEHRCIPNESLLYVVLGPCLWPRAWVLWHR